MAGFDLKEYRAFKASSGGEVSFDKSEFESFKTSGTLATNGIGKKERAVVPLQDIGKITSPVSRKVEPIGKGEIAAFPITRLTSALIEKPAWAMAELAARGGSAVTGLFGRGNKAQVFMDRMVEIYGQPGKFGIVTPSAERVSAAATEANYQRSFAQGIVGDISEAVTDFGALIAQIALLKKVSPKTALGVKKPFTELAKHLRLIGGHAVLTTKGGLKDRAQAGLLRVSFNITPYIANATGAVGINAVVTDAMLNIFISSPTYLEAIKKAGGINEDFLRMIIPQFIMDIGMAWNTRGLPRNIALARMDKYLKGRVKEMQLPKKEGIELMDRLRHEMRNVKGKGGRLAISKIEKEIQPFLKKRANLPSQEKLDTFGEAVEKVKAGTPLTKEEMVEAASILDDFPALNNDIPKEVADKIVAEGTYTPEFLKAEQKEAVRFKEVKAPVRTPVEPKVGPKVGPVVSAEAKASPEVGDTIETKRKGKAGLFYGNQVKGTEKKVKLPAKGNNVVWIKGTSHEGTAAGAPLADAVDGGLIKLPLDIKDSLKNNNLSDETWDTDLAGLIALKRSGVDVAHFPDLRNPGNVVSVDLRNANLERLEAEFKADLIPKGTKVKGTEAKGAVRERSFKGRTLYEAVDKKGNVLGVFGSRSKAEAKVGIAKPVGAVEPKAEIKPKYEPNDLYNIEYKTPSGHKVTMVKGTELGRIETELSQGKIPKDPRGQPILGISDKFQVRGKKAELNVMMLKDILDNLYGKAEKASLHIKKFTKTLGAPFQIGEKYPRFGKVYREVSEARHYTNELFAVGAARLDAKSFRGLPKPSRRKIIEKIRVGNTEEVARYFNRDELKAGGFNESEIKAYRNIVRALDLATGMNIKHRKIRMNYDKLSPDDQAIADEAVVEAVKRKGGYFPQTRLGGDFAVYAPPKAEGEKAYFSLHRTRSEARKVAASVEGGNFYLRKKLDRELYKNLTMADLENLIEASGVEADPNIVGSFKDDLDAPLGNNEIVMQNVLNQLRDTLAKRGFNAHWIERKNVPGFDWSEDNFLATALDYIEGSAMRLGRTAGRTNAEKAFRSNIKGMSPELRSYTRDYIDNYFNTGAIGYRSIQKLLYTFNLALRPSWLAANLTQPLATTYPDMLRYFKRGELDDAFLNAYNQSTRYVLHRLSGRKHGLSNELKFILDKLHDRGVLGDQLVRFQTGAERLGPKVLGTENFERWIGLFGRWGEGVNRSHSAIMAYRAAKDKQGITDREELLRFITRAIGRNQFEYDKHNIPTLITGAGNIRHFLRTAYTFRGFQVNFLQLLNGMMPWRAKNKAIAVNALGTLTLQAGVKGLPFAALISSVYKTIFKRTLDTDLREAMVEAGVPGKAIDLTLHGAYTLTGVDASNRIGAGDLIPTYGTALENIIGAPASFVRQMSKAAYFLQRGDTLRALENASPAVIREILKGARFAREGVKKASGKLVATPTQRDVVLQTMGFTPINISKVWLAEEALKTEMGASGNKTTFYNQELAKAQLEGNKERYLRLLREINNNNRKAKSAKDLIDVKTSSINFWIDEMLGISRGVPKKFQLREHRIKELFGQR